MKNFKLLTVAVVLAELMIVNHNAMAAEQSGTPMARKASAARRGGLMAFRKAVQNRQIKERELTETRQTATAEKQRADTAEKETSKIKLVFGIKEIGSLDAKREIATKASELQKVVNDLNEDLDKIDEDGITIGQKAYNKGDVQYAQDLIQTNIPTAAESAIRAIAIEKQAFDQEEKDKKTTEEKGWNGIMFTTELKNKIDGLKTKDELETYLKALKDQGEFLDYKNKLAEKGISYFWNALLVESLGLESAESTKIKDDINKENCLKIIGQVIDAAMVPLNLNDTDSDDEADNSNTGETRDTGNKGGSLGAVNNMLGQN